MSLTVTAGTTISQIVAAIGPAGSASRLPTTVTASLTPSTTIAQMVSAIVPPAPAPAPAPVPVAPAPVAAAPVAPAPVAATTGLVDMSTNPPPLGVDPCISPNLNAPYTVPGTAPYKSTAMLATSTGLNIYYISSLSVKGKIVSPLVGWDAYITSFNPNASLSPAIPVNKAFKTKVVSVTPAAAASAPPGIGDAIFKNQFNAYIFQPQPPSLSAGQGYAIFFTAPTPKGGSKRRGSKRSKRTKRTRRH